MPLRLAANPPLAAGRVHRHVSYFGASQQRAHRAHVARQLSRIKVRPVGGLAQQRGRVEVAVLRG